MQKLWFGAAGTSFGLCVALIGVDAARNESNPYYSLWGSPLAAGVYVTAAIGFGSLICALFNLRFPDLGRRRLREQARVKFPHQPSSAQGNDVLGEYHLKRIKKISAASGYTRAEKQRLLASYYGRRIQISGIVVEVGEWAGSSSRVTVRTCVRNFTAFMNFSDRETFDRYLSILGPRQQVTVVGQIEQMEPNSIVLVNCEIVSIT